MIDDSRVVLLISCIIAGSSIVLLGVVWLLGFKKTAEVGITCAVASLAFVMLTLLVVEVYKAGEEMYLKCKHPDAPDTADVWVNRDSASSYDHLPLLKKQFDMDSPSRPSFELNFEEYPLNGPTHYMLDQLRITQEPRQNRISIPTTGELISYLLSEKLMEKGLKFPDMCRLLAKKPEVIKRVLGDKTAVFWTSMITITPDGGKPAKWVPCMWVNESGVQFRYIPTCNDAGRECLWGERCIFLTFP